MTVTLHQRFAFQLRQREVGFPFDEFAQRECALLQLLRARIVRKKSRELIAKNGDAARLEADDRDIVIELLENLEQQFLCGTEKSPVVERTSAAEALSRDGHFVAGRFEDLDRGHGRIRIEVVV